MVVSSWTNYLVRQVLACSYALTHTCISGSTPERSTQSASANDTLKPSYDKILRSLIMLEPEKLPLEFRQILVCPFFAPIFISVLMGPSDLVQQGISEKVALVANFLGAFVAGFVLAYVRSWRLALAMSSILPCIAITGGIMNKFISSYMQYVHNFIMRLCGC